MLNSEFIVETRQRESISSVDFAKLLGISVSYLSMLEKGKRKPSVAMIQKFARITKIPIEKLLSSEYSPRKEEALFIEREDAHALTDMKSRLNREHRERHKAEERIWELEQANEHLLAEIRLHGRFEEIIGTESLAKSEKMTKLEALAVWTMEEGELSFNEIQHILKVERTVLRGWLNVEKRPYKCRFLDGGEIFASSPGEAALCLRCFDCEALESNECLGHGDEQRPENIMELLDRLKANGVYDGARQSQILEKYYGVSLSSREISSIRYRGKKNLPIPDDVLYLDIRKKK